MGGQKWEPSEALETLLLELAGYEPGTAWADVLKKRSATTSSAAGQKNGSKKKQKLDQDEEDAHEEDDDDEEFEFDETAQQVEEEEEVREEEEEGGMEAYSPRRRRRSSRKSSSAKQSTKRKSSKRKRSESIESEKTGSSANSVANNDEDPSQWRNTYKLEGRSKDVLAEAQKLKHEGNRANGAKKHELFLRAGLRYLDYVYKEKGAESQKENLDILLATGRLLEYSANACRNEVDSLLRSKARDADLMRAYAALCVLACDACAISYMYRMYVNSNKMEVLWCHIDKLEKDRVRNPHKPVSMKGVDLDKSYREFIFREAKDCAQGTKYWRLSRQVSALLSREAQQIYEEIIRPIPSVALLSARDDLHITVETLRRAVPEILEQKN